MNSYNISHINRILALLVIFMSITSLMLNVINACGTTIAIKDRLEDATELLEYLLQEEYGEQIEAVQQDIINKSYDINTSMESLYEKGSIFTEVDYVALMAAYITIIRHDFTIHDIEFITFSEEKKEIEYTVPIKTYDYEELENGEIIVNRVKYITEAGTYDIVSKNEDGTYFVETKEVNPEVKSIAYGDYTLHLITPEELIEQYGEYSSEEELEALIASSTKRSESLHASGVSIEGLAQSIMLNLGTTEYIDEGGKNALVTAIENSDANTAALLTTASSLLGMVPYEWGGKPSKAGYDSSWWTIQDGKQKGLDCSGFVCWSFMTAGYGNYNNLYSTYDTLKTQEYISKDELKPGDLGLLNHGENTNHVGIYLGDGYFIHCSSSKGTVVVSQFPFAVFMRVSDINNYTLTSQESLNLESIDLSSEDVMLIAKTVSHEAKGEGLNGWIAVTEVILNRLNSGNYGNTIYDIVYEHGQFSYSEEIQYEEPSTNIIATVQAVCDGKIRILNDSNIYWFRNPLGAEDPMEDWLDLKAVVKINNHVFYKEAE